MTIRTLFQIVLKILGLYFLRDLVLVIPEWINTLLQWSSLTFPSDYNRWGPQISVLLSMIYYGGLSYLFIFKANDIIRWLKLDKGYGEDRIETKIEPATVLSICIVVIGGLFAADAIPRFVRYLVVFYQSTRPVRWTQNPGLAQLTATGAEIAIGIVLITEQRRVVRFILNRRKASEEH